MRKGIKYSVGIAGLALAALALTACSNGGSNASTEKVTLTYANWNLGTKAQNGIERQMVAAWNKANPNVQVKIDETISGSTNYQAALSTAASAGKLPDIWMTASVADNHQSGWTKDLTSLENADSEFTSLPAGIKTSVVLGGKNEAIPFGSSDSGFFVNNDLLNKLNITVPTYKTSISDWIAAVKKATNLSQKYIGVSESPSFVDWMPQELDTSYTGLFSYDSKTNKVDLTGSAMTQAMSYASDLGKNGYSFAQLTADQQKALSGGTDAYLAFQNGQVAFLYSQTASASDLASKANFNFSWMGLPGGRQDIVMDYLVMSEKDSGTKAQDAYNFAKYMSTYGKDGMNERMTLTKKAGTQPAYLPLTTDSTVNDSYWKLVTLPGIKDATSSTADAMLDPMKTVPGWINARWNAVTGLTVAGTKNASIGAIVQAAGQGQANWSDYSAQLQTLSQKQLDTAAAALK